MRVRCIPPEPRFVTNSERVVWEALRRQLPAGSALLHGMRFVDRDGTDREADLIVAFPDVGVVVLEVKGGQVTYTDGRFHVTTPEHGSRVVHPYDQALEAKHLLATYLSPAHGWRHGRIRLGHAVVFPHTTVPDTGYGPAAPRDITFGRQDIPQLADLLWRWMSRTQAGKPPMRPDAVDDLADVLGNGMGQAVLVDAEAIVASRHEFVERLTADQARILDLVRSIPRYEIVGGPGTGKTFLALEQARRWCRDGRRTALVCYSRGLARWCARRAEAWDAGHRGRLTVSTFHGLATEWGVPVAAGSRGADYWDGELPEALRGAAAALAANRRFGALVVDEAQDFADSYWDALIAAATNDHRLAVFRDDAQRVFGRAGSPPVELPSLSLDDNLRNSQQIAAVFSPLASGRMRHLGGEGPDVEFVACSTEGSYDAADAAVDRLLGDGWSGGAIAVLTTRHKHPMHTYRVDHDGQVGYWDSFWDDDEVFYGTVGGFKGLERPAVVLAVDGFHSPEQARDVLLVGLSRARDRLVVCADPAVLEQVGPREVARRLVTVR